MCKSCSDSTSGVPRRDFMIAMSAMTGAALTGPGVSSARSTNQRAPAVVTCAFLYPPTKDLDEVGYYSWPGSSFDAEGREAQYRKVLAQFERDLGIKIDVEPKPLDKAESVDQFLSKIKGTQPDGLLLIPFKKSHFESVARIVEGTDIPTVVMATMGILLNRHVQMFRDKPGVHLINSLDNFDAISDGLKMIRAKRWMKESLIADINVIEPGETETPFLGTRVRVVPAEKYIAECKRWEDSEKANALARTYLDECSGIIEPNEKDVYASAASYFALKGVLEKEGADAVMMNCLPGLSRPHKHVPPCMGFMNLRDEGIVAGCESDLDATLSMMLIQTLFDKPAFQHNPSMDTIRNLYFGAHCTAPSKMNGKDSSNQNYILRSHAEAGWGCVPQVLFTIGQEVTFIKYLSREDPPQMLIYGGEIVRCPDNPPCGGCRTNVEIKLKELDDARDVKGHHLCLFYGDSMRQMRQFCKLFGIQTVS